MRKFWSYGPVDTNLHYYAPGDDPTQNGYYITVWAPRQTGKSWVTRQVIKQVKAADEFEIGVISLQSAKTVEEDEYVLKVFVDRLRDVFDQDFPQIRKWAEISTLFTSAYFSKPLILIIDEFDALEEKFINRFANEFRDMYLGRMDESGRSVLGIENVTGSPFNVQRSVHIPNLERDEVVQIFQDYQDESGQQIEPTVVARIYDEMQGQPGLTCWLGELLTEEYNRHEGDIAMDDFNYTFSAAVDEQPNNNILNIISKAKKEEYKPIMLEMFQAGAKLPFRYDDPATNYLYMNGVVGPSPFVQKRLFNYFSHQLFMGLKRLYDPFTDLSNTITDTHLNIVHIIRLYEDYVDKNRGWLFKQAPRRKTDEHIYEAVYHFNLYMYLVQFLEDNATVFPEFPTGNGKIDLVIQHSSRIYLLEIKSFVNRQKHQDALEQAAEYAQQLALAEAWLITFIEVMTDEQRASLEITYQDPTTGVVVHPVFVITG